MTGETGISIMADKPYVRGIIAIVTWEDPATYSSWSGYKESVRRRAGAVMSVGILLREDADNVHIALDELDRGEEFHSVAVIPRRAILRMRKVKIPKGILA